jgi:hypothetical protein
MSILAVFGYASPQCKKRKRKEGGGSDSACRGEGSAVGPLLAVFALPLRCRCAALPVLC